ncbi:MAG: Metallo-dependent phosphatase [candidate division TM6 bacterium GW2011_GWF2_30_66]|jgi:metallophosphoesterase (TIGR00282 family)|nr:MAG: Metallo-dependent phosphatase [candidate division TM6 bacterium GW2011_GWF2_30_66]
MSYLRILFLGDVVGTTGRVLFQKHIAALKAELNVDAIIVNGENSAHGKGITSKIMRFFKHNGVDVVTSGNHIWRQKDIYPYLNENKDLLRPENYPSSCPGTGVTLFGCKGYEIGVINLQGRIFMRENLDCPFKTAESVLTYLKSRTNMIFIDFHAEATSEKIGLAYYLDGKISGLVGTHTHVQTADERILPGGTAYISDIGMAGSLNSMIGMQKESVLSALLTQMPSKFEVDVNPPYIMTGAYIDVDPSTGKAVNIKRVKIVDQEPLVGLVAGQD